MCCGNWIRRDKKGWHYTTNKKNIPRTKFRDRIQKSGYTGQRVEIETKSKRAGEKLRGENLPKGINLDYMYTCCTTLKIEKHFLNAFMEVTFLKRTEHFQNPIILGTKSHR